MNENNIGKIGKCKSQGGGVHFIEITLDGTDSGRYKVLSAKSISELKGIGGSTRHIETARDISELDAFVAIHNPEWS
jgi:hypothetical protein